MKKIVIYVVVFDPIKILVGWAHQNDHQNLSFVKAINVIGTKNDQKPIGSKTKKGRRSPSSRNGGKIKVRCNQV